MENEYERAEYIMRNLMGLIEKNMSWPNKEITLCLTKIFSELIGGLYREQVCLIEVLKRKEQRIMELNGDEWAVLEEIE